MMQRIFRRLLDDMPLRLSVTALFVTVPLVIAISWLGGAYRSVMGNDSFVGLLLRFFVSSFVCAFAAGSIVIVPLERWVIGERAVKRSRWRAVRVLLYLVAGIPIGGAILLGIRLVVGESAGIVESGYFVNAMVFSGAVGTIYTFIEQAAEDVRKRERELKREIDVLRIEIDAMRRAQEVEEITETEYFQDLRARARELREEE
jgi:hypothetical protein